MFPKTETSSLSRRPFLVARKCRSSHISLVNEPADSTTCVPQHHEVRRLHPQQFIRHVMLSNGTTMFHEIFESVTKELTALFSIHDEDQGGCSTTVNVVGVDWRIHLVFPQHAPSEFGFFSFVSWAKLSPARSPFSFCIQTLTLRCLPCVMYHRVQKNTYMLVQKTATLRAFRIIQTRLAASVVVMEVQKLVWEIRDFEVPNKDVPIAHRDPEKPWSCRPEGVGVSNVSQVLCKWL